MEGGKDPFNRRTYPWGAEDGELLAHYRQLGQLRKNYKALRNGDVEFFHGQDGKIGFSRKDAEQQIKIYVNRNGDPWQISAGEILLAHGNEHGMLAPGGWCILLEGN